MTSANGVLVVVVVVVVDKDYGLFFFSSGTFSLFLTLANTGRIPGTHPSPINILLRGTGGRGYDNHRLD